MCDDRRSFEARQVLALESIAASLRLLTAPPVWLVPEGSALSTGQMTPGPIIRRVLRDGVWSDEPA